MRILTLALGLVLVAATVGADHPECPDESDYAVETPVATYYVTADDCTVTGECIFSIWVYEESNGHPGLQRGDEVCYDDGSCGPCSGTIEADTIIF